jgi:hypothetical protein
LIAAAQRVEHYEMAGYGCLRQFAMRCGQENAAELLQETLDEEGDTDHKLTDLAESVINVEALTGDREVGRTATGKADRSSKSSSRTSRRDSDLEAR